MSYFKGHCLAQINRLFMPVSPIIGTYVVHNIVQAFLFPTSDILERPGPHRGCLEDNAWRLRLCYFRMLMYIRAEPKVHPLDAMHTL